MNKAITFSLPILTALILLVGLSILPKTASADCITASTDGYTVAIKIAVTAIVPNSSTCTNGYNFNYALNYDIKFAGINIPSSLYTLQGNVKAPGYSANFFDLPNNGGVGSATSSGNSYTNRTDCNTATVASYNPSVEIIIQGPGIPYQTFNCAMAALPVEFVYFVGTTTEEGVLLKWTTAIEKNNKIFSIEKSTNAADWSTIAEINGAGTSHQLTTYSYIDAQSLNGDNYYRVKQTDIDGAFSYSTVIKVNAATNAIETKVYPNPAVGNKTTVSIASKSGAPVEIQIFDNFGRVLKEYFIESTGIVNQSIDLPETGSSFFVTIIQEGSVIGKHRVIVTF